MELRHLRYFAAAVEEGSLQAAAKRMNVAQPALSRRVRDLELEVGCDLLVRSVHGVTPTAAGTAYYQEISALLLGMTEAAFCARRIDREQDSLVRFGLVKTVHKYQFVQRAFLAFKQEFPVAEVTMERAFSRQLSQWLRERRLDLTLLYEHKVDNDRFQQRLIHKESYVLAVHAQHPLATAGPISIADISGHPLVWLARGDHIDNQDSLLLQCRLHGAEPTIGHLADSYDEQIELVIVSGGACLTPASTMLMVPDGALVFRPIQAFDMELPLSLAWDVDIATPAAVRFVELMHQAIDDHQCSIASGSASWAQLSGQKVFSV